MKRRYITAFPSLHPTVLTRRPAASIAAELPDGVSTWLSSARAAAYHAAHLFLAQERGSILVPSYHCGVEIEALRRAGARLVYYPVGRDGRVAAEQVSEHLDAGARAVFLIHYWGFPQDPNGIEAICRARGVLLIEDCAHALYSRDGDIPLGSRGDAALFSLPKTLPTPDGGVLLTRSEPLAAEIREASSALPVIKAVGRSLLSALRSGPRFPLGEVAGSLLRGRDRLSDETSLGMQDYGETPLAAYAKKISRVSRFILGRSSGEEIRDKRRRNYARLCERLEGSSGLHLLYGPLPDGVCPLFLPAHTEDRNGLELYLLRHGIETFVFGRHLHPSLAPGAHDGARFLSRQVLGLPVHQDLNEDDMERIALETLNWLRVHTPAQARGE